MTALPGKLTVSKDGKVRGPASIGYADPFPARNGTPGGGSSQMLGVVMHTEVGYDHNVQVEFETPRDQASAFFSIRDDGHITQYGPIGFNWEAWAQVGGNSSWYSIEHEDKGNPRTPLTQAQIASSAQLLECLSGFAGFPLQEANSTSDRGYGVHYMGGVAWGGHTCPDVPPRAVRSLQRPAIIALAKQIRSGVTPGLTGWIACDGKTSLEQLAQLHSTFAASILRATAESAPGGKFPPGVFAWLNGVFRGGIQPGDPVPAGTHVFIP